jgi:hypothetical protein
LPRPASSLTVARLLTQPASTLRYSPDCPRHLACDQVTILSAGFAPLQGITHTPPPNCVSTIGSSLEVPSPTALEASGVRFTRGFQTSARFGFRVSHPLADLLLPVPLGFVSPRWHSWGFRPTGIFPHKKPRHLFDVRLALLAFSPNSHGRHGATDRRRLDSRS